MWSVDPQYLDNITKPFVGALKEGISAERNSPIAGSCSAGVPGVVEAERCERWW